jgi:phage recombination protein Bet
MNAITKASTAVQVMPEGELIDVLRASLYPGAKTESIKMVLGYCKARGLDPMKKPVHIVPMWSKEQKCMIDVVMPGVNSYRTDAARTGEYAGKTEPEFGPDTTRRLDNVEITFPLWCKVTVTRMVNGRPADFTAVEYWMENYATAGKDTLMPNTMWRKRPYGQLAKCAEAQVLRMAFPEETGGENTNDEMEGKFQGPTIDHDAPPRVALRQEPPAEIPSMEEPAPAAAKPDPMVDVVQDLVDKIGQAKTLAALSDIEARSRKFVASLESSGRPELKAAAIDALAVAYGRFRPAPAAEPREPVEADYDGAEAEFAGAEG